MQPAIIPPLEGKNQNMENAWFLDMFQDFLKQDDFQLMNGLSHIAKSQMWSTYQNFMSIHSKIGARLWRLTLRLYSRQQLLQSFGRDIWQKWLRKEKWKKTRELPLGSQDELQQMKTFFSFCLENGWQFQQIVGMETRNEFNEMREIERKILKLKQKIRKF